MSNKINPFISNDDNKQSNNPGGNNQPGSNNTNAKNATAGGNNSGNGANANSNGSGQGPINPLAGMMNQSSSKKRSVTDFLIDYRQKAQDGDFTHAKFRDNEVLALLSTLTTIKHPNALLIGDAGVGKTQIVEELALQLEDANSLASQTLGSDTHIFELPISLLVGGTGVAGSLEQRLNAIIDFASDPDNHVILFIDEIHQLFGKTSGQADTIIQALKPALARGDMHVIAATTTNESRELQQDPAFNRRFTSISVPELSDSQTLEVLKDQLPRFNKKHNTATTENVLPDVINYANQYMTDSHRPDTALTLLDRASAMLNINQTKLGLSASPLTTNQVKEAVMAVLNSSEPDLDADSLSQTLHEHIIGQDYVIDQVVDNLKRYALGLNLDNKPTSFLFAGPTGTGKSEIAKQISKSLFKQENSLITLNMTEYTHSASLNRLLGSDTGYVGSDSHEARPLDSLRNNKFQVVLLDEFEKSCPEVQRVFMQALDEGFITDHHNQVIDFSHAIVIATTNAGATELQKPTIGFANHNQSATDLHDAHDITDTLKKSFPVELLNRFSHVLSFNALGKDAYKQILKLNYNQLAPVIAKRAHVQITPMELNLDTDYDAIDALANSTYEPNYNARPAKRTITKLFEDSLIAQYNQPIVNVITQYTED